MHDISLRDKILIAIFAALTAIGAFIRIPTPLVPFTLQFLFCAYAGIFLGARHGLYSQLLYVGIGLIGIPVFANGGGPTYLLQPTFGYLLGFIVCSYVIGKLTEAMVQLSFMKIMFSVLTGLFFVYLLGATYLYLIVNLYLGKSMSIYTTLTVGVLPYITSDLILTFLIAGTSLYVLPALRRAGYIKTPTPPRS